MNSVKIIKHLKKLSKTETKMPIDLSETKIYWANKLATKLKEEQKILKLLHYEKITDTIDTNLLHDTQRDIQSRVNTRQR